MAFSLRAVGSRLAPPKLRRFTRQTFRAIGLLLAGFVLLTALGLGGAFMYVRSDAGERWLTTTLQKNLNTALAPLGLSAELDALHGPLPSRLEIEGIRLSDSQGVWLSAKRAALAVRWSALLGNTLEIQNLELHNPVLMRLPLLAASPEEAPALPADPTWMARLQQAASEGSSLWATIWPPYLPALDLKKLRVNDLVLEAPVALHKLELTLDGQASASQGGANAHMRVWRSGHVAELLSLRMAMDADQNLDVHLSVHDAPQGEASTLPDAPNSPEIQEEAKHKSLSLLALYALYAPEAAHALAQSPDSHLLLEGSAPLNDWQGRVQISVSHTVASTSHATRDLEGETSALAEISPALPGTPEKSKSGDTKTPDAKALPPSLLVGLEGQIHLALLTEPRKASLALTANTGPAASPLWRMLGQKDGQAEAKIALNLHQGIASPPGTIPAPQAPTGTAASLLPLKGWQAELESSLSLHDMSWGQSMLEGLFGPNVSLTGRLNTAIDSAGNANIHLDEWTLASANMAGQTNASLALPLADPAFATWADTLHAGTVQANVDMTLENMAALAPDILISSSPARLTATAQGTLALPLLTLSLNADDMRVSMASQNTAQHTPDDEKIPPTADASIAHAHKTLWHIRNMALDIASHDKLPPNMTPDLAPSMTPGMIGSLNLSAQITQIAQNPQPPQNKAESDPFAPSLINLGDISVYADWLLGGLTSSSRSEQSVAPLVDNNAEHDEHAVQENPLYIKLEHFQAKALGLKAEGFLSAILPQLPPSALPKEALLPNEPAGPENAAQAPKSPLLAAALPRLTGEAHLTVENWEGLSALAGETLSGSGVGLDVFLTPSATGQDIRAAWQADRLILSSPQTAPDQEQKSKAGKKAEPTPSKTVESRALADTSSTAANKPAGKTTATSTATPTVTPTGPRRPAPLFAVRDLRGSLNLNDLRLLAPPNTGIAPNSTQRVEKNVGQNLAQDLGQNTAASKLNAKLELRQESGRLLAGGAFIAASSLNVSGALQGPIRLTVSLFDRQHARSSLADKSVSSQEREARRAARVAKKADNTEEATLMALLESEENASLDEELENLVNQLARNISGKLDITWQAGTLELATLAIQGTSQKQSLGLHLAKPVTIRYGALARGAGLSVSRADIDILPTGHVFAEGFLGKNSWNFQAALENFDLGLLRFALPALPTGSVNMKATLSGSPARPAGELNIQLDNIQAPGTLMPPASALLMGELTPSKQGSDLRIRLELPTHDRNTFGVREASASIRLPITIKADGVPVLSTTRPLSGELIWQGELGPLWNFLPLADKRLLGNLGMSAQLSGTWQAPHLSLDATIAKAEFQDLAQGVLLKDIQASLKLDDGALAFAPKSSRAAQHSKMSGTALLHMSASDGAGGTVKLDGNIDLTGMLVSAKGELDQLKPLRRQDLRINLSGNASLEGTLQFPIITADISINTGELLLENLPGGNIRTLDISQNTPEEATSPQNAMGGLLNVNITAPNRFFVRGHGLESEWKASISLQGVPSAPILTGTLTAVRGDFDFLNRGFKLTRGQVLFSGGAKINPLLDIVMSYQTAGLNADIGVSGSVSRPRLGLSSQPAMPQDEILSHIMFGQSASRLSRMEALQLAGAVAALAGVGSGGFGVLGSARDIFGVDVLRLTSNKNSSSEQVEGDDDLASTALEVGKYVTDRIYVGLSQGLSEESTGVLVEIELTPSINFEARSSNTDTEVGVEWKYDY